MNEKMVDSELSTPIEKNSSVPLYMQVRNILRGNINKGIYGHDSVFPPESEICREFSISRITTRQAIDELVREGILVRIQGKGTFVNEHHLEQKGISKTKLIWR